MDMKSFLLFVPLTFAVICLIVYGQFLDINYVLLWGAIMYISIGVAIASGIEIFGSGMSSFSVKVLFFTSGLGGLWGFLIVTGMNKILLEMPYGWILVTILTMMYILGMFYFISGSSEGE